MADEIIRNTLLSQLKKGDHIASKRSGDYEHHGIYIEEYNGVHKVTHFKAPIKDSRVSGAVRPAVKCTVCEFTTPRDGGLVTTCIDCFCRGEDIFIIRYQTPKQKLYPEQKDLETGKILRGYRNNKLYRELYSGGKLFSYTKISSDDISNEEVDTNVFLSSFRICRSPEQVLEAVQSNHYMGKYSFLFNNCEDFAVYCMIGKERKYSG